ncbi:hypothetical protein RchiOBHm_Chr7g0211381 [Rosa chinensis]|uniref:Uncharacterized protein n=1 Tax=Rosa chinensis TaxID=74649 RepID=A0A2P6PAF1_ROSCH|nr:hypothetical protein RchiOBHm_Chr7g0211381 [Rosa chinensis]
MAEWNQRKKEGRFSGKLSVSGVLFLGLTSFHEKQGEEGSESGFVLDCGLGRV